MWDIAKNGAGLYFAFKANGSSVWLNATLLNPIEEHANCGSTCGSGFDMYAFDPRTLAWRWVATTTNTGLGGGWDFSGYYVDRSMATGPLPEGGFTRYRIHLPI